MTTWWGNFENYWGPNIWIFYTLLSVPILSILVNLIVFSLVRRKRVRVKVGLGRILAIVGAFITLISVILPWETFESVGPIVQTWTAWGVPFLGIGGLVYVFGLLWLTFFAVPWKIKAILGVSWGSLALLFTLLALETIATSAGSHEYFVSDVGYGVYVSINGSLVLIVGSASAYVTVKKGTTRQPTLVAAAPPVP